MKFSSKPVNGGFCAEKNQKKAFKKNCLAVGLAGNKRLKKAQKSELRWAGDVEMIAGATRFDATMPIDVDKFCDELL